MSQVWKDLKGWNGLDCGIHSYKKRMRGLAQMVTSVDGLLTTGCDNRSEFCAFGLSFQASTKYLMAAHLPVNGATYLIELFHGGDRTAVSRIA